MSKGLGVSLAVLVLLVAAYVVVMRVAPPPDRKVEHKSAREPGERPALDPGPYPTEYDEVTVKIEIPPLSEFPSVWAEGAGCPQKRLPLVLKAAIGPGNGCPVLLVEPDGPAAKAGLQRLDRLGTPDKCASSIEPYFRPKREAHTVEWTVRRPKGASAAAAAPVPAPAPQAPAAEPEPK